MSLEILHRAALGSTASLGTLYDARTDRFYGGISVFKREIPPAAREVLDSSYSDVQFVYSDSISEKCSRLNIYAELQVSILMGLISLTGSGSYISNKKQSARSVRSSLVYNIRTKNEKLNLYHEDLKPAFSLDALGLQTGSTHFVSEIEWGANSMLTCEYENIDNEDELEIGGKLSAQLEFAGLAIKGSASVDFAEGQRGTDISFKFRVFGDVMPDDNLPTTIDAAVELMRQVPRLVNASNSGKGKPISYTLLPISLLKDYLELEISSVAVVRQINKSTLTRVLQFFEALEYAEQILFDLHTDVKRYSYCLQREEISTVSEFKGDVDVHAASMRADLAVIMRNVRSGEAGTESVDEFLRLQKHHEFSPANITSKVEGLEPIKSKLQFARRVRAKGAKYIGSSGSLSDDIQDIYDKKLIVFYVQPNAQETDNNRYLENSQLFFHQILNLPTEQAYVVVDCAFQTCPTNNLTTIIQVIQRGVVVVQDLLEDHKAFEGQPVVQLLTEPKRSLKKISEKDLYSFTTHCPGKSCDKTAKYNWICSRCGKKIMQGKDEFLYCDCGQTSIFNASYKCSDARHGLEFNKQDDAYVHDLTKTLRMTAAPKDCEEVLKASNVKPESGVYQIYPYSDHSHPIFKNGIKVFCDHDTDEGGWTVIHRRMDETDFFRGWDDYSYFFGNLTGSHWLGLETMNELTKTNEYSLRIDLQNTLDERGTGVYSHFSISDASKQYKLNVTGFMGEIGNGLSSHNGRAFSTHDRDNDMSSHVNCAQVSFCGWWFTNCGQVSLNGRWKINDQAHSVGWGTWKKVERRRSRVKIAEMKIRKRSFTI